MVLNNKRIKLFDGKPTTREVFYQRALTYISQYCDEHAKLVADTALEYAGISVVDEEYASQALTNTVKNIQEGITVAEE